MDTECGSPQSTVLVVDDEPVVLNLLCNVLQYAGYEVLRASTPEEALRIGSAHPDSISLLVCDVIMPGLTGPSVAEQFSTMHPETACLFIAGYPENSEVVDRVLNRGLAFLPKPFVPKTLLGKVCEVLASTSDRAMAAPA